jgi:adenylate cyclase
MLESVFPRRLSLRARLFLLVAAGSIGAAVTAYALHFRFLDNLERQTIDLRFSLRGDQAAPKDIVIVKIDDLTFSELREKLSDVNVLGFRRSLHAKVLDRVRAGKPRVVAVDIQFTEPTAVEEDNALIEAVGRNRGHIVLATTEVDENGKSGVLGGEEVLREFGARDGNALLPTDKDGIIRHFDYEVEGLKSFAVVAAELATGRPVTQAEMGGHRQWIDFAGRPGTFTSYSYSRVLNGKVPPSVFRDKVVVIGPWAPALQDIHATPTGAVMAGPEIQANAIETALRGFPLRGLSTFWNVVLIVVLGLVVPLVSLRAGPLVSIATGLALGALFTAFTLPLLPGNAFDGGRIVSFIFPVAALAMSTVGSLGLHYAIAAFERERVRDIFSRFVPETVVDQVLAQTDADLRLGGKEITATVLFSDLRGFTTFSETRPAEEVITILNQYLGEMSEAILHHGGTLVSYMGDGIMAVFGAPIEQHDHADRALAAAREMVLDRLPPFNAWMEEQGLGQGFLMGVGLNSGPIAVGNVGHQRRLEYTAIGDVTNTASRIEGLTKGTPYSVFVSESTRQLLRSPADDLVFVDEMEVRGRQAKLRLWALNVVKPGEAAVAPRPAEPEAASAEPAAAG